MFNRSFHDLQPGDRFESVGKTVSEGEILDFAFRYDPQPIHMDARAAEASPYGGLIASGIHTLAIATRLMMQSRAFDPTIFVGSPGIEELEWLAPVRAGDTLRVVGIVREAREARSNPEHGVIQYSLDVLNQNDETIMTMISTAIVLKREGEALAHRS